MAPRSPSEALRPEEAAPPPKRSRQARYGLVVLFNSIISLLMILAIIGFGAFYFGKQRFEEPGPLQTSRTVVIREGSALPHIAQQLRAAGIIDSELLFRAGVRAHDAQGDLQAGEYAFDPRVSMLEAMETLRQGKAVVYKVSIPEGLTVHQIFERLDKDPVLVGDLPDALPLEGSLMPDTYPFQRGTTRAEVVDRMRLAQERFVSDAWDSRNDDLPLSSPEELVTLASIVEKETGRAEERSRVAAVFINRLRRGMRLQSDPTILYGLFGGEGRPSDRPIFRSDIDRPTPYNTYQIDGLPPGPIANPGRAAIEAVINSSATDELYFVADGTGGHVFATTLAEHNENVRRWREIERKLRVEAARVGGGNAGGDEGDDAVDGAQSADPVDQ